MVEERVTAGAAVEELIWPVPSDPARDLWRNIKFRFTVMALMLSPDTADRDVGIFHQINCYRNEIHGQLELPPKPPTSLAVELFDRYCRLTVDYRRMHTDSRKW